MVVRTFVGSFFGIGTYFHDFDLGNITDPSLEDVMLSMLVVVLVALILTFFMHHAHSCFVTFYVGR